MTKPYKKTKTSDDRWKISTVLGRYEVSTVKLPVFEELPEWQTAVFKYSKKMKRRKFLFCANSFSKKDAKTLHKIMVKWTKTFWLK